jgi:hypothetical protein
MPDLKAFDAMLNQHAAPVLKAAGFRKKGRTFRFVAPNGDHAFVHFQTWISSHEPHTDFVVNLSVVPVPQMEWIRDDYPQAANRQPAPGDGLWQDRAHPPKDVAGPEPHMTDLWRLADADAATTCGALLADVLREHAAPLLIRLTDRAEFLAMVRDPARPLKVGLGHAEIMLLVDEGPSAELDAEIAVYEAMDPKEWPIGRQLAAWARQRSSRSARTHS